MIVVFGLVALSFCGVLMSLILVYLGERVLSKKESDQKHFWSGMGAFMVFSLVVVVIWLLAWFLIPFWFKEPKGPGEAGDMFGGVTSLFSGLAFAGLISTLLMQRRELKLQRDELTLSRTEFGLQRFENTFFGLIKLFTDHVSSLEGSDGVHGSNRISKTLAGRSLLERYAARLPDQLYQGRVGGEDYDPKFGDKERSLSDQIREYEVIYDHQLESDLGPYFRLLYNALRHIEYSGLSEEEKLKYSKVLRAYLSSSEVKLLMFNCASARGRGMKEWVIKHKLLKHMHPEAAAKNRHLVAFYGSEAFDYRKRILRVLESE